MSLTHDRRERILQIYHDAAMDKQAAAQVFAVMRGAHADISNKHGRVIVPKGTDAKLVNVDDGKRFEIHGSGGKMRIPVPPTKTRMAALKNILNR
jgi:hypothetical protein